VKVFDSLTRVRIVLTWLTFGL